mmetsp:Transcript_3087/g.11098  ORF Transcript_3087/g.11098 Transcript_3087/m.11098 type:complete len:679 (+) Transcript_3087:453-2489(+)
MSLKRSRGDGTSSYSETQKAPLSGQGLAARRGRTESYALDVPGTQLGPIVSLNLNEESKASADQQQFANAPTTSSERNELIGFSDTPTQTVPWDDYINDLPSSKSLLDALPSPFGLQNLTGVTGRDGDMMHRSPKRRRTNDLGTDAQFVMDSPESQMIPTRNRQDRVHSPSSDDLFNRSCATPSPARRQGNGNEKSLSPGSGRSIDQDQISLAEALQQVNELKRRIADLQHQQKQQEARFEKSERQSVHPQGTHPRTILPQQEQQYQQALQTIQEQQALQQHRAILQQLSSRQLGASDQLGQSPDSQQPLGGYRGRQFLQNIAQQQQQLVSGSGNAFLGDSNGSGSNYLNLLSPQLTRQLQSPGGHASPLGQLLSPLNGSQPRPSSVSPIAAALGQHSPISMNSLMQNNSPTSVLHRAAEMVSSKGQRPETTGATRHQKMPRMKWTLEEDEKVRQLVEKYGEGKWVSVAADLKTKNPKQVHARWRDYLRPGLKNDTPWTEEERARLLKLHAEYGNCWSKISDMIPGRSANAIKNRINAIRRQERAGKTDPLIERACMQSLMKPKSPNTQDQCSPSTKHVKQPKSENGQYSSKHSCRNGAFPVSSSSFPTNGGTNVYSSTSRGESPGNEEQSLTNQGNSLKQAKYPSAEITPQLQQHLQVELSMVQNALKLLAKQKARQ